MVTGLVLLVLLQQPADPVQGPIFPVTTRSSSASLALEFAPTSGVGMGTECACGAITGSKGETVTFTRASSAACSKADGTIVTCSSNQPRVESSGGYLSLRAEGSTTNGLLRSEELNDAAWSNSLTPVLTADSDVAPDGTTTGDTITDDNAAGHEGRFQNYTSSATGGWTASCYMKAGTLSAGRLTMATDGTGSTTCAISGLTSSWSRRTCSATVGGSPTVAQLAVDVGSAPADTGSIKVWGCQLEQKAAATSYVRTVGSTATRAAELARIPWPSAVTDTIGCVSLYGYKDGWNGTSLPTALGGQGNTMAVGFISGGPTDWNGHDGTNTFSRTGLTSLVGRWEFAKLYWDTGGSIGGGNKIGFHVPGNSDWLTSSYDGTLSATNVNIGSLDGTSRFWDGLVSRVKFHTTITGCN